MMRKLSSASGARWKQSEKWGFSDNVLPDAVVLSMSIEHAGSVVSSPVEEGSFATYNKISDPVIVAAELGFQGTEAFLRSTLDSLKTLQEEPETFSIKTPAQVYDSFSLESFDYVMSRESGVGVLYVKARFVEVKEVALEYTRNDVILPKSTKASSAASPTNRGNVQGTTVTEKSALYGVGAAAVNTVSSVFGGRG